MFHNGGFVFSFIHTNIYDNNAKGEHDGILTMMLIISERRRRRKTISYVSVDYLLVTLPFQSPMKVKEYRLNISVITFHAATATRLLARNICLINVSHWDTSILKCKQTGRLWIIDWYHVPKRWRATRHITFEISVFSSMWFSVYVIRMT